MAIYSPSFPVNRFFAVRYFFYGSGKEFYCREDYAPYRFEEVIDGS